MTSFGKFEVRRPAPAATRRRRGRSRRLPVIFLRATDLPLADDRFRVITGTSFHRTLVGSRTHSTARLPCRLVASRASPAKIRRPHRRNATMQAGSTITAAKLAAMLIENSFRYAVRSPRDRLRNHRRDPGGQSSRPGCRCQTDQEPRHVGRREEGLQSSCSGQRSPAYGAMPSDGELSPWYAPSNRSIHRLRPPCRWGRRGIAGRA